MAIFSQMHSEFSAQKFDFFAYMTNSIRYRFIYWLYKRLKYLGGRKRCAHVDARRRRWPREGVESRHLDVPRRCERAVAKGRTGGLVAPEGAQASPAMRSSPLASACVVTGGKPLLRRSARRAPGKRAL
jgi:hypothetical protein